MQNSPARSIRTRVVFALAALIAPLGAGGGVALPAQASAAQNYVVVFRQPEVPSDAAGAFARAGGSLVYSYNQIGVAIARASGAAFRNQLRGDDRVASVTASAAFGLRLTDIDNPDKGAAAGAVTNVNDEDGLKALQWDMRQIHAFEAQEITKGNRNVVVGDIDTGLDYTHPKLAPNVDYANSVSCIDGKPDQRPAAWADDNGHGTHTAGTIAASNKDGGFAGVAPRVKIAGIKAGDKDGFFFPDAVICAFMWAGSHHIDVTNNSYFADPWLYNCLNDKAQRDIYVAEKRAIDFAMGKGVTVVAAAGNENDDLAHPTVDNLSPDFPPGNEIIGRPVAHDCFVVPAMVPGVISVSADGNKKLKSFYSTYGKGFVKVTAPGGDSRYQVTTEAVNGRVLSTYPAALLSTAPRPVTDCDENGQCVAYAYFQGTSMASPHVAGLAALIVSAFGNGGDHRGNRESEGDDGSHPRLSPREVLKHLTGSADPLPCPPNPFNPTYPGPNGQPANCEGTLADNSFYGFGQINALRAVRQGDNQH
jgi:subtilisin family serine protease